MDLSMKNCLLFLLCLLLMSCDSWTIYNRSIFDNTDVERLSYFVEWNSPALINRYMARYPNVDIDTESDTFYGTSLLIYAIFNNKYEAAEALLQNGADPNFVDRNGETPLSTAMHYNEERKENKYICLLLKHGANPDLITRRGGFNDFVSPLYAMSTSTSGSVDAVKLLVEKGKADIHIRNWYVDLDLKIHEYNIMEYACRMEKWDVMCYLVEEQGMGNYLDSLKSDGVETLIECMRHEGAFNTDRQLLSYKRKIQSYYKRMHSLHGSPAGFHAETK